MKTTINKENKVGIDIVANRRIKLTTKFITRILSANEQVIFQTFTNKHRKIEFLAGRWASKEAIFKATNKRFIFNLVDIAYDENGAPYVNDKNFADVQISISHEQDYTIAIAIV